jgi:phage shock protein PspC (stress-responsive transcriptional regulator)
MTDPTYSNPTPSEPGPGGSGAQPDRMRLHRVASGRMIAGVAAGLADYLDVDPTLVRIGFVVLALMGGIALPLYLAGWLLIPDEGSDQSMAEEMLSHQFTH